jgi:hypothetical protein
VALRRFWPAALALAAFVALVASLQFVTAPRHYTASQELRVSLLGTPGGLDAAGTAAQAGTLARTLSSAAVMASPQLASAVLGQISATEQERQHMSDAAIAAALSATHSDGTVTLAATWTSPAGADEILAAAVNALERGDAVQSALGPTAFSARVQATGAPNPATRTPGEPSAYWATLLARVALGLAAAALLPFALARILPPRSADAPSPAAA